MFSKKTACFVTGASRGLGESIAVSFSSRLPAGSLVVLLARSEEDLDRVKRRLLGKSPTMTVVEQRFDQSTQVQAEFEAVFTQSMSSAGVKVEDFEQAILVHNAGTLKPMVYTRNMPAVGEVTDYLSTNVSGVIALTAQFLNIFSPHSGIGRVVINISSLAALQPIKSWALYCTGKAARDMFFKVLAEEEKDIRVLTYAPGPLVTNMSDTVATSEDEDIRNWALNAKSENKLLPCDKSVARLIEILDKNAFKSGQHVDVYDEI